jgi:hypothetical protein
LGDPFRFALIVRQVQPAGLILLPILIAFLFRRCADIYIDFLVAANEPAAKDHQSRHYYDHKNYQYGYDPSTTASAIVSHDFSSSQGF